MQTMRVLLGAGIIEAMTMVLLQRYLQARTAVDRIGI